MACEAGGFYSVNKMFLGHQEQSIIVAKRRQPKYDNYAMKTYIYRDLEADLNIDKPPVASGLYGDLWNVLILLLLYTIQGEKTNIAT